MTTEQLTSELQQLTDSLTRWQGELEEAQRQILLHTGHIDRIKIWLEKLDQPVVQLGHENDTVCPDNHPASPGVESRN